jgi:phosphate starvation-inducible PhoH-like protein
LGNEAKILLRDTAETMHLLGMEDAHLRMIEERWGSCCVIRGGEMVISGAVEGVRLTETMIRELLMVIRRGHIPSSADVLYLMTQVEENQVNGAAEALTKVIGTTHRGKPIKAKTRGQIEYLQALSQNDVVFAIGPAGTGKTYLAVVMAVQQLKAKAVNRIILTRPVVEAGEKLGFLPGDIQEKVDPYLRPLYDALYDLLGSDTTQRYVDKGTIEIAPLAYMRGRTLDDSFIILDEAQNTTPEQMKMFLTRLGFGSQAVVTGDVTQIDLPRGHCSGLKDARSLLKGIPGIYCQDFSAEDVVRNSLVRSIIQAYEEREHNKDA